MGIFAMLLIGGGIYAGLDRALSSEIAELGVIIGLILFPFVAFAAGSVALLGVILRPNALSVLTGCVTVCIGIPLAHYGMSGMRRRAQLKDEGKDTGIDTALGIAQMFIAVFWVAGVIIFATEPFNTMFPSAGWDGGMINAWKTALAIVGVGIGLAAFWSWRGVRMRIFT